MQCFKVKGQTVGLALALWGGGDQTVLHDENQHHIFYILTEPEL